MLQRGLIIEGITGAGKTQTLKAIQRAPSLGKAFRSLDVFREKETFGDFMAELIENPGASAPHKLRRLNRVLETVGSRSTRHSSYGFILERAHYSYYALLPDWSLYEASDRFLANLNAVVVLLHLPPAELRSRSLYRVDRDSKAWAGGFLEYYQSESNAMLNFERVQERRYEGIRKSAVPHVLIDTSDMAWDTYAEQILKLLVGNYE